MKNLLLQLSALILSMTAFAQAEKSQPEKTIDSVKAIQKQEQIPGKVTSKIVTSDELPLRQEKLNTVNENNKINDNGSINGNSVDTNNNTNYTPNTNSVDTNKSNNSTIYNSRGTNATRNSVNSGEVLPSQQGAIPAATSTQPKEYKKTTTTNKLKSSSKP